MMKWKILLAWLAGTLVSAPHAHAADPFFEKSYAVVIGIDHYPSQAWPQLRYGVKDAHAIEAYLNKQNYDEIISLYDQQATKQAIIAALQNHIAPKLKSKDRVLIFFAGHGFTETLGGKDRGYIVPYDGDTQSAGYISMDELETLSDYMGNARHQLFIMDSCYGGLLAVTRGSLVNPNIPDYLNNISGRVAREVITAGGKDQQVLDGGPNGHSYFVDYLLEALADGMADTNGDGYITFSELSSYLIPRASNRQQTPAFGVLSGHQAGEYLFRSPTARVPLIAAGEPASGPLRGAAPTSITPPSDTDLTASVITGSSVAGSIAAGTVPAEHLPSITPSRTDGALPGPTWPKLSTGRDVPIEMELIRTLKPEGANQHINSIAFSPDGRLLAAASDRREGGSAPANIVGTGGAARVWDIESGTQVRTLHATVDGRPPESVRGVTFSPDGKLIATSASLTLSPVGTPAYAEKRRQNLQLWNVGDGTLLQSFPTPEWGRGFDDLAFSSDGRLLAGTTEGDSSVPIWDLNSQALIGRPVNPNSAVRLAFQPMSHVLAVADNDQRQGVLLWQANGGRLLHSLHSNPPSYGSGVAFSPDGRTLVTGHFNGRVHLWNASDGQSLLTFQLPNHSNLQSFALSPDGRILVVIASLDAPAPYPTYELQLWDAATGKQLRLATHPSATSNLLVLDPAGPRLAVVSGDNVKVWRLGPSIR